MDRWIGGALVVGALLLYFVILPAEVAMPRIPVGGGVGGVAASPPFFPRLIAAILALLGLALFLRGRSRAETLARGEGFAFGAGQALRVGGTAGLLVGYVALLEVVGYVLLTPVTLALLAAFLGFRRWTVLVAVAVGVTAGIYLGFRWGMKILLPEGLLG